MDLPPITPPSRAPILDDTDFLLADNRASPAWLEPRSARAITGGKFSEEGRLARILDVGCGPNKYPGATGVDMNPNTAADVLCHLDQGGLPFRDNSFDQVRAEHFIEHVADVIATMEEFHRVTRPGGTIFILTPHYTDCNSFTDPTHRRHLNTYSFHYFYPGGRHGRSEMWYTKARMREARLRVRLLRLWRALGFEFLVNHSRMFRQFWEQYLSFVIRGKLMEFTFEVIK